MNIRTTSTAPGKDQGKSPERRNNSDRRNGVGDRRFAQRRAAQQQRIFLRGTNLQPTGKKPEPCLIGSKQSIMVDLLSRPEGATMEELMSALSGGQREWQESSVRAGFGWDMKLKGYGVRSEFDPTGEERFHLVLPKRHRKIPAHVTREELMRIRKKAKAKK